MKGIDLFFKRETPIDFSLFDKIEKQLRSTLPYEYKLFMSEYLPEPRRNEILILGILLPYKIFREEHYADFHELTTLEFISTYDRFSIQEPLDNFLFIGISIPEGGFYLKLNGEDIGSIYYFDFRVSYPNNESILIASNFMKFIDLIVIQPVISLNV